MNARPESPRRPTPRLGLLAPPIPAQAHTGNAGRRVLPMTPEELLEAAVLIYLRGLGVPDAAAKPGA